MAKEFRIKHGLVFDDVSITTIKTGTTTLENNDNCLVTEKAIKTYIDNNSGGGTSGTTTTWYNNGVELGEYTEVSFNSGLTATIEGDKVIVNLDEYEYDTLTTTSTTAQVISTITIDENTTTLIESFVTAYSSNNYAGYSYSLVITRGSGAPTIQLENSNYSSDSFGWGNNGYVSSVNGNNVQITIQSDDSESINWKHKYKKIISENGYKYKNTYNW